jgi:AcrR family transcriptional regulator
MALNLSVSKGEATRDALVGRAHSIARLQGLEGFSINDLAASAGMSKSGVFAHFGSRQDLQLAVLDAAAERFTNEVLLVAFKAKRGLPRLRALQAGWIDWVRHEDGGCLMLASASEYDDKPGPIRDRVVQQLARLRVALTRTVQLCIDSGDFAADGDAAQIAFEFFGIVLCVHHDGRLFGHAAAAKRGRAACERLIADYRR